MRLGTRKVLDRSFTGLGVFSIGLVATALVVLLAPIVARGLGAFVFRGTVEHRRMLLEKFNHGDRATVEADVAQARAARQPVYDLLAAYERTHGHDEQSYVDLRDALHVLLGPLPGERTPVMPREQYGQTRWDRAQVKLHKLLYVQEWDYSDPTQMGKPVDVPRAKQFAGTELEPLFPYLAQHAEEMLRPRLTCYWRFLFDDSLDAHIFGGIWAEVLGTLYLTLGAILFAVPMGIIAAIYLIEYAPDHWTVGVLRSCISTLAGVPSIVFGLFGLAFFINTAHVSKYFMPAGSTGVPSKSVLAGALTLALLILPVIIRASEEAIRAVPRPYKAAALSLGATKWWTILTVILPAALPGILTGIVISMGRAAGETAPIIFTAAVSFGEPLQVWQTLTQPTPALPWNVYNLCSEHEAADEIRHVQYGMVLTLVALVLVLNGAAIILRARISSRLTG
jgi:phosphate transport system permease protein